MCEERLDRIKGAGSLFLKQRHYAAEQLVFTDRFPSEGPHGRRLPKHYQHHNTAAYAKSVHVPNKLWRDTKQPVCKMTGAA